MKCAGRGLSLRGATNSDGEAEPILDDLACRTRDFCRRRPLDAAGGFTTPVGVHPRAADSDRFPDLQDFRAHRLPPLIPRVRRSRGDMARPSPRLQPRGGPPFTVRATARPHLQGRLERMKGLEPSTFCMAKSPRCSRPFAQVRSNRLACSMFVSASERERTRTNAEPCHSCHALVGASRRVRAPSRSRRRRGSLTPCLPAVRPDPSRR